MKLFRTLVLVALLFCMASFGPAQNTPTNAPQFQVSMNFLGATPYGVQSAMDSAFTNQFTANIQLRGDVIVMPAANYTGYFGGPQYNLCGFTPLQNLLASTSLNCGKFSMYMNGAVGLGRLQIGTGPAQNSLAGLVRTGANYDPSGAGHFTLNVYECGWGSFGPGARSAWFCQTGFSLGLGSSASATEAKVERIRASQAKKMKKLQDNAAKANAKLNKQ